MEAHFDIFYIIITVIGVLYLITAFSAETSQNSFFNVISILLAICVVALGMIGIFKANLLPKILRFKDDADTVTLVADAHEQGPNPKSNDENAAGSTESVKTNTPNSTVQRTNVIPRLNAPHNTNGKLVLPNPPNAGSAHNQSQQ